MRTRFKPIQTNKNRIHVKPSATGVGKDAARVLAARRAGANDPTIIAGLAREAAQNALARARHALADAKLDLEELQEEGFPAPMVAEATAKVTAAQTAYEAAKKAHADLQPVPEPIVVTPAPAAAVTEPNGATS